VSEKTQPDVAGLQQQVQELLDKKDQLMKKEDEYRLKITDQQTTISQIREEVHELRRTVAGTGFSLARLKNEMDMRKRANEELEHRNHSLRKELRRAGQTL